MFKVNFNCANSALPNILSLLDGQVSVRVTQVADAGEVLINKTRTAVAIQKSAKARTARKQARVSRASPGSKKGAASTLVRSVGLQPFRAHEIVARGAAKGIAKPAIYQAIYAEIAAGNLRKLGYGEYQKTGAGALEAVNG